MKNIFNVEKTDYNVPSMFLGQEQGLVDSIHRHYPELWMLYKKLKAQDWDEINDFDFSMCNQEFKTCHKNVYDMMILTLAWQWEADSIASRTLYSIGAPFITSTEVNCLWVEITKNELIHALTYSEIVRNSFDNPDEIIPIIHGMNEAVKRSETVSKIFNDVYEISHRMALGEIDRESDTAKEAIYMFITAMFCLERIQFMSSFAVTFAIANSGIFTQIGKAVQKICQDELEIHVETHRSILNSMLKTEEGLMLFNKTKNTVKQMVDEVVKSELDWVNYLFSEGRELIGVDKTLLSKWVLYNAKDVYKFFGMESENELPLKNPLGFITNWINIDGIQGSPQEEKLGAYLLGGIVKDTEDKLYDIQDL